MEGTPSIIDRDEFWPATDIKDRAEQEYRLFTRDSRYQDLPAEQVTLGPPGQQPIIEGLVEWYLSDPDLL